MLGFPLHCFQTCLYHIFVFFMFIFVITVFNPTCFVCNNKDVFQNTITFLREAGGLSSINPPGLDALPSSMTMGLTL